MTKRGTVDLAMPLRVSCRNLLYRNKAGPSARLMAASPAFRAHGFAAARRPGRGSGAETWAIASGGTSCAEQRGRPAARVPSFSATMAHAGRIKRRRMNFKARR